MLNFSRMGASASSGSAFRMRSRLLRTSLEASSRLVPQANSQVTLEVPSIVALVISSRPFTVPSARSTSFVTLLSTSSALAPSQVVTTVTVGCSISGIKSTGSRATITAPSTNTAKKTISVVTGRWTPSSDSFIAGYSPGRSADAPNSPTRSIAAPSVSLFWPMTTYSSPSARPATISTSPPSRTPVCTVTACATSARTT